MTNMMPSIPSVTPFFILVIADFAAIVFLLYKRLKDIGLQQQYVQGVAGIYAAMAGYTVYTINSSIDKIISGVLSGSSYGKGVFDIISSAGDITFAFKIITILNIIALAITFVKGSSADNQYGKKPMQL